MIISFTKKGVLYFRARTWRPAQRRPALSAACRRARRLSGGIARETKRAWGWPAPAQLLVGKLGSVEVQGCGVGLIKIVFRSFMRRQDMPLHIQRRMRELRTIFIKSLRTRSLFPLSITKKCLKWATLRRVFWLVSGKRERADAATLILNRP